MADHLYFIRVKDGPVKIGRAGDVHKRLKTLQTASPYELVLVGVSENEGFCEGAFHMNLWDHHLRGEWFEWTGKVAEAVEAAVTTGKWRTVFGHDEPPSEDDWRDGSPLYAAA